MSYMNERIQNSKIETMLSKMFQFQKEVQILTGMNIGIKQLSTHFLSYSKKKVYPLFRMCVLLSL